MNESLLHRISQIIIEHAEKREVIEYNQISKKLDGAISSVGLNKPLGEISQRCIDLGFPPLSTIVVNHDTRFPGEGFFTWVAAQMGYPNLIHSKWEEFYYEQEQKVFDCMNWNVFLTDAFANRRTSTIRGNSNISTEELLASHVFLKGKKTKYYILTSKEIQEGNKQTSFQYRVLTVENRKLINEATVKSHEDKYSLAMAKRKGIQLLLEHTLMISIESISMAHHTVNEDGDRSWDEESTESLNLLFKEERREALSRIAHNDIEAEKSQEDLFYRDGKAIEYYGTRYERNPINRARAIELHGTVCKACDFDFEKAYGKLGRGFIEVHHVRPLSTLEQETAIDPEKDLVPLCSNCHRMVHRKKEEILEVDKLKSLFREWEAKQHDIKVK